MFSYNLRPAQYHLIAAVGASRIVVAKRRLVLSTELAENKVACRKPDIGIHLRAIVR